jgi:ABC-type multidrug transport system fused ATPase/permease subunit
MGFVLDGLDTQAYDRAYSDRELVQRIVGYFRPHARRMVLVGLMLALNSMAGSAGPIIIARAIDLIQANPSTGYMLLMALGVLLLGAAGWGFNYIRQWRSARVVGDVVLKLREDVFDATIRHDLSFFDEHPSGKIVSRVTSDTQDFATVATLVMDLLSQVMLVGLLAAWLGVINARLTLLLLAMSPIAVLIALRFRRVARRVTRNARRVTAKINAQIQESISGIVVAKSFRQESTIYDNFAANNAQAYAVGLRRGLTLNTIFPIMGFASGLGTALLVYAGGLATRDGLSPGDWYLFMQAVGYFWWPLMNISSFWSQFQDGLSAAERAFALIDAEPRVVQVAADPVGELRGGIEFRHLTFAYDSQETVLPDFSLEIAPGETVALVGHTGAGKSSVARLISRFYEFQSGNLLIDGRDIRRLDLQQFRTHIGVVPQEPFLFSGTVAENIAYGCTAQVCDVDQSADDPTGEQPEAVLGDDQVRQAAMRISKGEWLHDLPDGLDTDVGERGANLSMGQRQLVALARVLLKNPAIFILDEATASVDPFTEMQIQEGLEAVMRDRTAIVIAHRLSTVRYADRILVIDRGEITEEGTHRALLAAGGPYAKLYETYFRHQSLEYIEAAKELSPA